LLRVRDLEVRYGSITAVRGVSVDLVEGELLAIVGPNGAGKSSLLGAIAGNVPAGGTISINGQRVDHLAAERRARVGIAFVPDGRRLFGRLTVAENLLVGAVGLRGRAAASRAVQEALGRFEELGERRNQRADSLSGGEGQLLMIARALVASPRVLLVDEPLQGLSENAASRVLDTLVAIASGGVAVALASPDPIPGLSHVLMEHGSLRVAVA
jgi:branched-chain amino acid transport system ATP-binding protein